MFNQNQKKCVENQNDVQLNVKPVESIPLATLEEAFECNNEWLCNITSKDGKRELHHVRIKADSLKDLEQYLINTQSNYYVYSKVSKTKFRF